MKIGNVVKYLFHPKMLIWRLRYIRKSALEIAALKTMKYDCNRFLKFAGVFHPDTKSNLEARIIHTYHGIEKGLTMPKRRYNFGHDNILSLVKLIEEFIATYGTPQGQVEHGIGILKAYLDMHKNFDGKSDEEFWKSIHTLTDRFPDIKTAAQPHKTYSEFYKDVDSNFEKFAKSRHTLRHYGGSVSEDEIKQAVTLAMTAPSA